MSESLPFQLAKGVLLENLNLFLEWKTPRLEIKELYFSHEDKMQYPSFSERNGLEFGHVTLFDGLKGVAKITTYNSSEQRDMSFSNPDDVF